MNYNAKNKNVVMIAIAFAVMLAMSPSSFAQIDEAAQNDAATIATDDFLGLDATEEQTVSPDVSTDSFDADDIFAVAEPETSADTPVPNSEENTISNNTADNSPVAPEANNLMVSPDEEDVLPLVDEPKSPFEKFGNAILSKVDNDLFNQMSSIEKQTTLLNLELKRESVKNQIEALRIQRQKAFEEEALRKRQEEEKLKDEENARQLKIIEAQEKVKQKEIELEKVRQAKVLKEYMNEMLLTNQKWVEMNTTLLAKIKTMEDERYSLIKDFENKMSTIRREAAANTQKAEAAKTAHERTVLSLNSQVEALQIAKMECQDNIVSMQKGGTANPFADSSTLGIDQNAIDMSDEYAIMDITGKGSNIVAKIVNKDGTTFIVHKGSMLKGGEVVTSITDNYIAFDNKGTKSYLYTGGTVMQREPVEAFNEAGKLPEIATPVETQPAIHNVRGTSATPAATTTNSTTTTMPANGSIKQNSSSNKRSSNNKTTKATPGIGSFSQGMFVR